MEISKALFLSQEITPYLPETTMSLLGRNIPQSLQESGTEVRTFMPKYGRINERRNQLHEVIRLSGLNIVIDDTDHPLIVKVATLLPSRMQVYFIDNDDYFHRNGATELEIASMPEDNDERIMFFARGVIETVKKLRWVPSLVQCDGWATALAPLYIRRMYADDPTLRDSKIVVALYENNTPAPLDPRLVDKLKMDGFSDQDIAELASADSIDAVTLGKIAIRYADAVIQAVPEVSDELLEFAKASGKPFMEYPADTDPLSDANIERFHKFYASL